MIPKKIYLNYVNDSDFENDVEITWSEKTIDVEGCKMLNREYTDLSQVWHDISKIPTGGKPILIIHSDNTIETWKTPHVFESVLLFTAYEVKKWAYIEDLLPKIE